MFVICINGPRMFSSLDRDGIRLCDHIDEAFWFESPMEADLFSYLLCRLFENLEYSRMIVYSI